MSQITPPQNPTPPASRGTSPGALVQWLLAAAIAGFGGYMLATGQGVSLPIFLIGVGLAFTPVRVLGVLGALVCMGAGAYFLAKHGQAGLLQGGLFVVAGIVFLIERLRPRGG